MSINAKQQKAIILIASGKSKGEAADAVGVTPQTISDWFHNAHFCAALNRLQRDQLEAARTELQAMAKDAVKALSDVMQNADSYETRRRAALDVLEIAGLAGDPTTFAWGIGPDTAEAVERQRAVDVRYQALLDRLGE